MSATIVWDLVDPNELIQYVRAFDNEVLFNDYTLQEFLPNTAIPELEYRIRTGTWKDVDVANYRAWDTPAPMTGRQGFTRIQGEIAPVSRQIPLSEEEFLRLRELQGASNSAIINAIYDDSERMVRAVQARIELARGELLTTGQINLNENGLNLTADFAMPGSHKPTAGTLWTNPAATMLSDLLTWMELYVDDTGTEPGVLLWPRQVLGYAYLNNEMRSAAAASGTTPSRINNETIDAIFAANGLPPVRLYDTRVRVNGTSTRVIPANKILYLPPAGEPLGATFYGVTAEALLMAGQGVITLQDAPGVVAVVTRTESPVQTYTLGTALAMPVLPNPELVICATVA
jgi:hypothetical protein